MNEAAHQVRPPRRWRPGTIADVRPNRVGIAGQATCKATVRVACNPGIRTRPPHFDRDALPSGLLEVTVATALIRRLDMRARSAGQALDLPSRTGQKKFVKRWAAWI